MAAALPHSIQLKLDHTLAQSRQWRCNPPLIAKPEVVRVFTEGLSNTSILVAADRHYVVRIDRLNPAVMGLNRQSEWRALQAASRSGLAPTPRYFNPELGSLVCDYLAPDSEENAVQKTDFTAVAGLLRRIHTLPALHHRLDLRERMLRYEKQIEHRQGQLPQALKHCRQQVLAVIAQVDAKPQARVLCHNDLLRANRINSEKQLWAIDWEYCAMGNPLFDLAVIAAGDLLTPTEQDALLTAYLGRDAVVQEQLSFQQQSCLYRYLEVLWYSSVDNTGNSESEQRLTRLQDALVNLPSP